MDQIRTYSYDYKPLTVYISKNGYDVYFNAFDIATILNYSNPFKAIKNIVDDDDIKRFKDIKSKNSAYSFIKPRTLFLTKYGVYCLIFNLKKNENAREFKNWFSDDLKSFINEVKKEFTEIDDEFY